MTRGRRHVPASTINSFIEPTRVEELLAPWLTDPADRAFVARCVLGEGPAHHRGANYVLLRLLAEALAARGGALPAAPPHLDEDTRVPVPMRLPPAVASLAEDGDYPLRFPRRVLERLAPAGSPALEAMIDCVTDGPPQHALANAAMLCLLDALLERSGA